MSSPSRWRSLVIGAALSLLALGGCASNGNPRDPLEPLNRGIYSFNEHADNLLIKPAATLYRDIVPQIVRTGVSNFFSNINDVIVALNSLLQGKVTQAALDTSRIVVNTTIGLLGVLDVATEMGLEKHNEDFGQTLGHWGFGPGPYLVLPFLGPSSLRDGIGLLGDWKADPMTYIDPTRSRNQFYGAYFISRRAELLETGELLKIAALDPYEFLRDGYLQRRRSLVYDGNPPDEEEPPAAKEKSGQAPARDDQPGASSVGGENTFVWKRAADRDSKQTFAIPAPASPSSAEAAPAKSPTRVVRVWLP